NSICYNIIKYCGMGAIAGTNVTAYNTQGSFSGGSDEAWAVYFAKHLIEDEAEFGKVITNLRDRTSSDGQIAWLNLIPYVMYGDPTVGIYTYKTNTAVFPKNNKGSLYNSMKIVDRTIQMSLPYRGEKTNLRVEMVNCIGKSIGVIYNGTVFSSTIRIPLDGNAKLSSGIYLCKVLVNGDVYNKTVIIQN
ncbi:MAG: hypothetical protein JW795_11590, partial [Chitinivibrionales bacterium]|nr:hypothetical protein [Chitinivibrionales bacterium]